ncbi:MAG TPA: hypothetical protein V6D22_19205 [Candidatus Obscuribacterales bacterium]
MKTTTSNYNAFNQFANWHKVQLSTDVQNLLIEETITKTLDAAEQSILQWTKLPVVKTDYMLEKTPVQTRGRRAELAAQETTVQLAIVQPLPAELMVGWESLDQGRHTSGILTSECDMSGTGLRRVITRYKGVKYTQSLPVAHKFCEALVKRLRPIMIDRRQEQQGRVRWFGSYNTRGVKAGCVPVHARHLLDNASTRWSA